nr:helix-turn-helix transcriptional regulator [Candidatus Sigynarchaeota archaeon]
MFAPPPGPFPFFDALSKRFFELLLLNTIKKRETESGGMTYTDLQKVEHLPHIKVYRILKRMEEDGLLEKKEERIELGRPRQLYSLSTKGEEQLKELKAHLLSFFDIIRRSFPDALYESFDAQKFLEEGTFDTFCEPPRIERDEKIPPEERLEFLEDIEKHMKKRLEQVKKDILELKSQMRAKKIDGAQKL